MKPLFDYTNYREFLADWFQEKKAKQGYTYRDFSRAAGMNSSAWLLHLIRGTKNLSATSALRIATALELNGDESLFFGNLVGFTQAKSAEEKDRFYVAMLAQKKRLNLAQLTEEQYAYYSKWFHPVIRSLISKVDWGDDYAKLAKKLRPVITPREAKASVKLLLKLGFIEKTDEGDWRQCQAMISTGNEVASLQVANYHRQVSRLSENVHDRVPRELRDISALTLGIGAAEAEKIKEKIQAFRKEIMSIAQESSEADRVYQLNFQFFPVSVFPAKQEEKP